MSILTVSPTKPIKSSKFSDGQLTELHSQRVSIPKLAKQLGVSQQSVCKRLKELGLKPNGKPGPFPKYKKAGPEGFLCSSCGKAKPLRQRKGTICKKCTHDRWVSTREGALRCRYSMKKCHARQKGLQFSLTLEYFKNLYEQQGGRDGYTDEQMTFAFGHGRSRTTVSLDRIDNEGGYTPDNVKFCCLGANAKKRNKPVDQFMVQLELDFSNGVSDVSQPKAKEESNPENTL